MRCVDTVKWDSPGLDKVWRKICTENAIDFSRDKTVKQGPSGLSMGIAMLLYFQVVVMVSQTTGREMIRQ